MTLRERMTLMGALVLALAGAASCSGRQVALGKNGAGELESCSQLSAKKKFEAAIECLEIYKSRHKGTALGQTSDLLIGDNFFGNHDYLLAAESYDAFLKSYPDHPKADYAYYRLGLSYFMEAPKQIDRDQQYLTQAIAALQTHAERYPHSAYAAEVKTQLGEAEQRVGARHYYIGRLYYRTGEYRAAIPRLLTVITDYPNVAKRDQLYWELVRATARLGDIDGARQIYTQMQQEWPASPLTKKSQNFLLHQVQTVPAHK